MALRRGVKPSPRKPATRLAATRSVCRPLNVPRKPKSRSGRAHSFRHPRSPLGYQLASGPSPAATPESSAAKASLNPHFLLLAFGFGLAGIFTPCVFPMVPLTVSYFLSRNPASRRAVLAQALLFCTGIVVLFSVMGFVVTLISGPFGVVQLSSSPWVNALIAAVFFGLGLSLLGAFEITLPSALLTRFDRQSQQGGIAGGLFLGLTFYLTSFACVGPFVGTLLASSIQASGWVPVIGMAAFAAGLATPFFGLALFPSYLQKLPRSGAWLARVKTVSGFVTLAVMFKYLSSHRKGDEGKPQGELGGRLGGLPEASPCRRKP